MTRALIIALFLAITSAAQSTPDPSGWIPRKALLDRARALAAMKPTDADATVAGWWKRDRADAVEVIRAGLRLPDADAARAVARFAEWRFLDAWEHDRIGALILDARRDYAPDPDALSLVASATEMTALVKRLGADTDETRALDRWRRLEPRFGPAQLPALLALTSHARIDVRKRAWRAVAALSKRTDRHRAAIARAFLATGATWPALAAGSAAPAPTSTSTTTPEAEGDATEETEPKTRALPDLLRRVLSRDLVAPERSRIGWAIRWLHTTVPAARDAEPLLAMAKAHQAKDDPVRGAAIRALRHLKNPAANEWLSAFVKSAAADDRNRTLALATLARRGVPDFGSALEEHAASDGLALALWMELDAARCLGWLGEQFLRLSARRAMALLDRLQALPDHRAAYFLALPKTYEQLEAPLLASRLNGFVLARLGATLPGLNTTRIAKRGCRGLYDLIFVRDLMRSDHALEQIRPALAFLEVAAKEAFLDRMRLIAHSQSDVVNTLGNFALLAHGDRLSADGLVDWVRSGRCKDYVSSCFKRDCPTVFGERPRYRLAAIDAPATRRLFDDEAGGTTEPSERAPRRALVALAITQGVPPRTAAHILEIPAGAGEARSSRVVWRRQRVLDGKAVTAVLEYLSDDPDRLPSDLWRLDRPLVRDALERLRARRSLGLYARATAILAAMGHEAARDECIRMLRAGRRGWTEAIAADPCLAIPASYATASVDLWRAALATTGRGVDAAGILGRRLGRSFNAPVDAEFRDTPGGVAREWKRCYGDARLAWSKITDCFVPVLDRDGPPPASR